MANSLSSYDTASVIGSLAESTASGTADLFLSEEALRQLEKYESISSTSIPVMASAVTLWRDDTSYQQLALRVLERAVFASPLEPSNKGMLGEIVGVLVQFVEEYWNIKGTQDTALKLLCFATETKAGAEAALSANGLSVLSRTLRHRVDDPDVLPECLRCIRNLILQRKTALSLVELQKDHFFALTLMDKHSLHEPCIGAALGLLVAVASSPACHQAQKDIIAAGYIDRVVRALKMLIGHPAVQTNGYELLKHLIQVCFSSSTYTSQETFSSLS
eukprot:203435_1